MVYCFVFGCGKFGDIVDDWFGYVGFDEVCGLFFGVIIDFVDYYDEFGVWIFFEGFDGVDVGSVNYWIIIDVDCCGEFKVV